MNRNDNDDDFDDDDVFEVDDPTDPSHPDYDLSTASPPVQPYDDDKPWFTRRWVLLVVAVFVIAGLIIPLLPRF